MANHQLQQHQQPLNLEEAETQFPINPELHDSSFLPDDSAFDFPAHASADPHAVLDPSLAGETGEGEARDAKFDAATVSAITASLAQATAHQRQQTRHQREQHRLEDDAGPSGGEGPDAHIWQQGEESRPLISPGPSFAPYANPNRNETTPHPLHILFSTRDEFEYWLQGEDSWTHYVLKRLTTPQKRQEERLKARVKIHEKELAGMTPEQRASAPPFRQRKRHATSTVSEKITYTCHHAGHYRKRHNSDLPPEKLRLKTKESVKCNCTSRIVVAEMHGGECKVAYYWRHEGHDPYSDVKVEGGRLPKIVDDWIISQVHAGKDPDGIKKMLQMSEEEKKEYIDRAAADPTYVTGDMPPPLALSIKVGYPDLYNRYRKLKGPIKVSGIDRRKRKRGDKAAEDMSASGSLQPDLPVESAGGRAKALDLAEDLVGHLAAQTHIDPELYNPPAAEGGGADAPDPNHVFRQALQGLTDAQIETLAREGHAELAKALLGLPKGMREELAPDEEPPEEVELVEAS